MSKKNIGKFLFGTVSLVAAFGAAFYFAKDYLEKKDNKATDTNSDDDFDGFDDEDLYDSREYVTINITHPQEDTIEGQDSNTE